MLIGVNQCLLDPSTTLRTCLLEISMFEKTKPIFERANGCKYLYFNGLYKNCDWKFGENKANSKPIYLAPSTAGG
jgi:hypothetical protein